MARKSNLVAPLTRSMEDERYGPLFQARAYRMGGECQASLIGTGNGNAGAL